MNNKIYCSTGTFIGRKNERNHRLVIEYGSKLNCDGFEINIFEDWYNNLDTVINDYKTNAIICPVIHADRAIMADNIEEEKYFELWKLNCNFGAAIGASKIVVHAWGLPNSDKNPEIIYERCAKLLETANNHNLDLLVENIVCQYGSPLEHIEKLAHLYPEIGLVIDTCQAQFHAEMEQTCQSPIWKNGNVRHIHISEYIGGYKEWAAFGYNAGFPQPGKGDINYEMFFKHLKDINYTNTLTLEAPSIPQEEGVDVATLNECLDFVRDGLN